MRPFTSARNYATLSLPKKQIRKSYSKNQYQQTWFDEASGITVYTEYYRWDIDEKFVDILAGSGCIVWECVLSEEDSHVIAIVHSEDNIYDYDLVNPYRKGYEFIGWSTVPDSTEAEYTSEDLINWNVPMEEDSVILYAVWVAVED